MVPILLACVGGLLVAAGLLALGYLLGRRTGRRRADRDSASSCFVNAAFLLTMADAVRDGRHEFAAARLTDFGRKQALAWRCLAATLPAGELEELESNPVAPMVREAADAQEESNRAAGLPTPGGRASCGGA